MARRILVVGYGATAYLLFLVATAGAIGFLANVPVARGIDEGPVGPAWSAVAVDAALLSLFAIQHSVMARPWFKRRWTRFVPAAVERSTYVLLSSLLVLLMIWQWRPLPATVWSVEAGGPRAAIWALYGFGWVFLFASTVAIGHADTFGLRQVLARVHTPPTFATPWVYRWVRHPMMVGFLIAFWATPDLSAGHALFAGLSTAYILVGVRLEETDLRRDLGPAYQRYARQVPRFFPRPRAVAGRTLTLTVRDGRRHREGDAA